MDPLRKKTGLLALAVALLALSFAGPLAAQYDTENVIIVSIDGIRDLEAFAYEFVAEEEHPYIPFIWETLKPKGTAFMEMYNDVCTFTSPGHATMLTGAWQMSPNFKRHGGDTLQTRAWEPTIFEYAQKDLDFEPEDTWCIVGKINCLETNYSIHPEYGAQDSAYLIHWPTSINIPDDCTYLDSIPDYDAQTVDTLLYYLDLHAPRLVFVNLRLVDEAGHLAADTSKTDCGFRVYAEAIRRADAQVERICEYVDTTETYAGNTTLIVTTDHGRHDMADTLVFGNPPDTLDFTGHSGICHGCRHVMCLVVGPDTPDSTVVTSRTLQVDITPTIMELLGGYGGIARFAEGQVLGEAIEGYSEPDRLIQSTPACDVQDTLVVVAWSDNSSGENQIWCTNSYDNGSTFSDTVQVSDSPVAAIQPDIAVNDDGVHLVWLDFQLGDSTDATYDCWKLFYKRDSDFDNDWDEEDPVDTLGWNVLEETHTDTSWSVWEPSIVAEEGSSMITVAVQPFLVGAIFSFNGGETWGEGVRVHGGAEYPVNVEGCRLDRSAGVVWCDQSDSSSSHRDWDVYYATSSNILNNDWTIIRQLSSSSDEYSIQPSIDSDADEMVYAAWADRNSGTFNIFFKKSNDSGDTWTNTAIYPAPPIIGSGGAWQPDLVFDRTTNAEAHLIWVKSDGDEGVLYYNHYSGSAWGTASAASVPSSDGSVNVPDFAIDDDGNMFVVWTDVTDSSSVVNWDDDPSE